MRLRHQPPCRTLSQPMSLNSLELPSSQYLYLTIMCNYAIMLWLNLTHVIVDSLSFVCNIQPLRKTRCFHNMFYLGSCCWCDCIALHRGTTHSGCWHPAGVQQRRIYRYRPVVQLVGVSCHDFKHDHDVWCGTSMHITCVTCVCEGECPLHVLRHCFSATSFIRLLILMFCNWPQLEDSLNNIRWRHIWPTFTATSQPTFTSLTTSTVTWSTRPASQLVRVDCCDRVMPLRCPEFVETSSVKLSNRFK